MEKLPKYSTPNLLAGMETMDDGGVYRISDDTALVQSVDFFYPAVNDPRSCGRIVAANSLSDIWAMGGRPITAMNMLAYPAGQIPEDAIEQLFIGGSEKLEEAHTALVGGHTLEQEEFVYGMSVTGLVHPKKIVGNDKARVRDKLVLTKPLGTGVYCSALADDGLSTEQCEEVTAQMERLNMYAAEVMHRFDVSALTDVTGFGLLGHGHHIARNGGKTLRLFLPSIPLLKDVYTLLETHNPQQVCKCRELVDPCTRRDEHVSPEAFSLLAEAQTSGGLLSAVAPDQAEDLVAALKDAGDRESAIIGEVTEIETNDREEDIYLHIIT